MTSVTFQIDSRVDESDLPEVGEFIRAAIVENTTSGKDRFGASFVGYSKNYFKSGTVDLQLSGEMLQDLDVLRIDGHSIEVGYINGTLSSQKAEGHILGTGANNALPIRDFLGLPFADIDEIESIFILPEEEVVTEAEAAAPLFGRPVTRTRRVATRPVAQDVFDIELLEQEGF